MREDIKPKPEPDGTILFKKKIIPRDKNVLLLHVVLHGKCFDIYSVDHI